MTNGLALFVFLTIAGLLALDHYVLQWEVGVSLARRGLDLIRFLAFWR